MYNEPFNQILESLAGIYRSYYELVKISDEYKDKVHIVIVADGYDKLTEDFLKRWENAAIYNEFWTQNWRTVEGDPGSKDPKHIFKDLNFINSNTMNNKKRTYGTNNIGHWFSRLVKFPELLNGLSKDELNNFEINKFSVYDFMLGSDNTGKVKKKIFKHIPMPLHFWIKHKNQGKIESHKWFFKGFWTYMNPRYAQIIDAGSIPLWNSISYITMHMEKFKNVGGAWGEIECILSEK